MWCIMAEDVKIDRQQLRKAVERVMVEAERPADPPEAPKSVREMDPEAMVDLFESGSIDDALQRIRSVSDDANWCFLCGASSSKTPERPGDLVSSPLTDTMIDRLAEELLDVVEVR